MMTESIIELERKKPLGLSREKLAQEAIKYISFMPGVSEILFYYVLLVVVKPFLKQQKLYPNFMLALIGPSGHLKTSLARLYAFWIESEGLQEVEFADIANQKALDEHISRVKNFNLIIDDMHIHVDGYRKNKQVELLDYLSRHCDNRIYESNIIVTGEMIPQGTIFSTRDRMFQVQIRQMEDKELSGYKMKLGNLSQDFMATLSLEFENVLKENSLIVQNDISRFHNMYQNAKDIDMTTRVGNHMEYIGLVEFLYKKYFCDESETMSVEKKFSEAIYGQGLRQHIQLCNLRQKEKPIDYVETVYNMFAAKKFLRAECDYDRYVPRVDNYCLYNGRFYITKTALQTGLINYLGRAVSMKKVSDAMHDAGVLEEDISSRTKKWQGIRHYVISRAVMELYCHIKESSKIE